MAQQPRLSTADRIRRLADRALDAADAMDIPSKTASRVERLIGEIEEVATELRAAVRGSGLT